MPYNLDSPNRLLEPCDLKDLGGWFIRECSQIEDANVRRIVEGVGTEIESFVHWPEYAVLLWRGCDRTPPDGAKMRYHSYPVPVKEAAKAKNVYLDGRPNGPAIAAFLMGAGKRPNRFGSSNAWTIHHLYSGKFPYIDRTNTIHASKLADHFTQAAGLVAVHPIADAMSDEFPFFAWMLRAISFQRFGYDPDAVFAADHDRLGFAPGHPCAILHEDEAVEGVAQG